MQAVPVSDYASLSLPPGFLRLRGLLFVVAINQKRSDAEDDANQRAVVIQRPLSKKATQKIQTGVLVPSVGITGLIKALA